MTASETEKLQLIFENLQNDCEGTEEKVRAAIEKVADIPLPKEIKFSELKGFVIRSARSRFDLLTDALAIRMAGGNVSIQEREQDSGDIQTAKFDDSYSAPIATTAMKENTTAKSFLSSWQKPFSQSEQQVRLEKETAGRSESGKSVAEGLNPDPAGMNEELSLFEKWRSRERPESTGQEVTDEIETHPHLSELWTGKDPRGILDNIEVGDDSPDQSAQIEFGKHDLEEETEITENLFRREVPAGSEGSQKILNRPGIYGSSYTWNTEKGEHAEDFAKTHKMRRKNSEQNKFKKRKITINDPAIAQMLDEFDRQRVDFPKYSDYIKKGCFRVVMLMGAILGILIFRAISSLP